MPEDMTSYLKRVAERTVTQAVDTLEEAGQQSITELDALRLLKVEVERRMIVEKIG